MELHRGNRGNLHTPPDFQLPDFCHASLPRQNGGVTCNILFLLSCQLCIPLHKGKNGKDLRPLTFGHGVFSSKTECAYEESRVHLCGAAKWSAWMCDSPVDHTATNSRQERKNSCPQRTSVAILVPVNSLPPSDTSNLSSRHLNQVRSKKDTRLWSQLDSVRCTGAATTLSSFIVDKIAVALFLNPSLCFLRQLHSRKHFPFSPRGHNLIKSPACFVLRLCFCVLRVRSVVKPNKTQKHEYMQSR